MVDIKRHRSIGHRFIPKYNILYYVNWTTTTKKEEEED